MIPFSENTPNRSVADVERSCDLGLAGARTVQLPALPGLFRDRQRSTEMLPIQSGFGDARADSLAKNLVFELPPRISSATPPWRGLSQAL
jgi:hypothetical protein